VPIQKEYQAPISFPKTVLARGKYMPISVGDIYFSANLTDSSGSGQESFSFVATTNIAAGEVITFHSPESASGVGNTSFDYTVGAGGLSAFDRVTIIENTAVANTFTLVDPSGGSISGFAGNGWSISDNDNIIAGHGGQVIAAIVNSSNNSSSWNANISETGLSMLQLANFLLANPTLSPIAEHVGGLDDNVMFSGTDITLQGSDPAFWVSTDTATDHANPTIGSTTYATQDAQINCFAAGTMIATPAGEQTIETLQAGDMILTADGGKTEVVWLARQTIGLHHGPSAKRAPVRIRAGALGNHSDLIVTADHGMIVDGLVINASALVNGTTIDWVAEADIPAGFTVYHVETTAHDVVLANGAASETFIDAAGRQGFDNYQEYLARNTVDRVIPEMDRPRISSSRLVPDAITARLGIVEESADSVQTLRQA